MSILDITNICSQAVIFIEFSYDPILGNITIDGFSNANGIEIVNQQGGSTGVDIINAKIGTKC